MALRSAERLLRYLAGQLRGTQADGKVYAISNGALKDVSDAVDGSPTFSGDAEITDAQKGLILRSPNGSRWRVTIDDSGTLVRTLL